MPGPLLLWNEDGAYEALRTFLVSACPEVQPVNVYRARPGAVPGAAQQTSIIIDALTPAPEYLSPAGSESNAPQAQRWLVTVAAAAPGPWTATLLGQTTAPFVAVPADTTTTIAAGLRVSIDALGAPVVTAAGPAASTFYVTASTAGVSLGLSVAPPPAGAASLAILDDSIRRAVWNWGVWRVRLIFRDVPSSQAVAARAPRSLSAQLVERVRLMLQASSLPVTNGLAYPYHRDLLLAAPSRLSWRQTSTPLPVDLVENGAWVRTVVIDVEFSTPVALTHDVPSLDAVGLAQVPIEIEDP